MSALSAAAGAAHARVQLSLRAQRRAPLAAAGVTARAPRCAVLSRGVHGARLGVAAAAGMRSRRRGAAAGAVRCATCAAASMPAGAPAPSGLVAAVVEGARARMAADPSFLFKLGVEVGMDEVICAGVNIAARGSPLLWSPEVALQVLCQAFVSCFNDIALVWCLAPAAASGGASRDPALDMAHVFQPGDFTPLQRVATWARKWRLYSLIGLATGGLSLLLTGALSRDPALLAPAALARAALTGALHLGVSANTRYQLVNGLEVLLYAALPTGPARTASVALRFANNCAGSYSWIALSAFLARAWPL